MSSSSYVSILKGLPLDLTLGDALCEADRIRLESIRDVKLDNLRRYRDRHRDELLAKRKAYRETHKVEIAKQKKEARLLKKTQAGVDAVRLESTPDKNIGCM